MNMSNEEIRYSLVQKLKGEHCLWSFDNVSVDSIPDDVLIEKVLVYLDLPEIDSLFVLFPYKKVKAAWLEHLVPQEDYYYTLNRFLSWYYFKAKRPDAYIKAMATRHFNKMMR